MINTIFVNFDGTLCISTGDELSRLTNYLFEQPAEAAYDLYNSSVPNKKLIENLYTYKNQGANLVLVSECSNKAMDIKRYWCSVYAPGLFSEFLSIGSDLSVTGLMDSYAKFHEIPNGGVILINQKF